MTECITDPDAVSAEELAARRAAMDRMKALAGTLPDVDCGLLDPDQPRTEDCATCPHRGIVALAVADLLRFACVCSPCMWQLATSVVAAAGPFTEEAQ